MSARTKLGVGGGPMFEFLWKLRMKVENTYVRVQDNENVRYFTIMVLIALLVKYLWTLT